MSLFVTAWIAALPLLPAQSAAGSQASTALPGTITVQRYDLLTGDTSSGDRQAVGLKRVTVNNRLDVYKALSDHGVRTDGFALEVVHRLNPEWDPTRTGQELRLPIGRASAGADAQWRLVWDLPEKESLRTALGDRARRLKALLNGPRPPGIPSTLLADVAVDGRDGVLALQDALKHGGKPFSAMALEELAGLLEVLDRRLAAVEQNMTTDGVEAVGLVVEEVRGLLKGLTESWGTAGAISGDMAVEVQIRPLNNANTGCFRVFYASRSLVDDARYHRRFARSPGGDGVAREEHVLSGYKVFWARCGARKTERRMRALDPTTGDAVVRLDLHEIAP